MRGLKPKPGIGAPMRYHARLPENAFERNPTMPVKSPLAAAAIALALLAAGPAAATVTSATPSSFLLTYKGDVKSEPAGTFTTVLAIGSWWSKGHTYSGSAAALTIEPRAGGCFCERWNRNSVEHGRVIFLEANRLLRLQTSLGPLQDLAVNGILTFKVDAAPEGSLVTLTYRVRGSPDAGLDKLAPVVDKVMAEQFSRLVDTANGARLDAKPADAPLADRYFDSGGVRLRYVESGSGDPVVLLHDFASSLDEEWIETGTFAELAKHRRMIALDLRGHGKSAKPQDPAQYGRELGQDVLRLLDELAIPRAHLVGYGLGAVIAAELVTEKPERFVSLHLTGSTPVRGWTEQDDRRIEAEAAQIEKGSLAADFLAAWPPGQPRPTEAQLGEASAKRLAGQDLKALAALRRSMRALALTDSQVAALKLPTLGVVGSDDPAIADFARLKAVMPAMVRLVSVLEGTHATTPRKPEYEVAIEYFLGYHPLAITK
jgi:pimeloyl-ACP methyl ester carboxylesterase